MVEKKNFNKYLILKYLYIFWVQNINFLQNSGV